MTDPTISELLSRHLDGDLDAATTGMLLARLEAEPELRAELDAMREIRRSVASLASSDKVPRELDQLVETLLRGKPDPVVVRPWLRWLATAAVIILGATVVIEFNRHHPGPGIESIARVAQDTRQAEPPERFTLAPLPTSSLPPEQQPLGASDRLLASPIPDMEFDQPPPLEVLGPLEKQELSRPVDETSGAKAAIAAEKRSAVAEVPIPKTEDTAEPRLAPSKVEQPRPGVEAGRAGALRPWDAAPPTGRAQLFVFVDGKTAWREFTPETACKPGRYAVRVVIAQGAVRVVRPIGGGASVTPSQRLCAADLVLELEIEGVADGEYPAEVVVEPRGSGESPPRE
jgi:hypothetical protein